MPRKTIDFDTVRQFAADLPGVEETTSYGSPALKAYGKPMAWIPPHKNMEPGTLVVRVDIEVRAELIEAAPDIYYVTNHYLKYPAVLVRMPRIELDALKDLLRMAYSFVKNSSRKTVKKRS